jgi:hypothetical protein
MSPKAAPEPHYKGYQKHREKYAAQKKAGREAADTNIKITEASSALESVARIVGDNHKADGGDDKKNVMFSETVNLRKGETKQLGDGKASVK